ncbi:50S ribosomal protein L19e [Methanocella paludicola SANAE]|uniref:Large ribosomal subunit protein eL19 n=1 Tax=Methanocella paludicola (strain DSM 17711 / JCM 13418 / NBRC 101707 / SANAE) TaxID=304371 RepID=D1Z0T9_METPS|nr:50S ribosomal protein L19e [Methanocella paludicola]BAI62311.1 50S ribosomal protein L19e [Methanocella paludicola SANAE]
MADLANQKRLAAALLKVGVTRVWMDPEKLEDIATAITREDIRGLIEAGTVKRRPKVGISRGRARARDIKRAKGHRKGHGSRRGAAGARAPKKEQWMRKIRAQRKVLREMREEKTIDAHNYRILYRKAKGGEFRNVAHLKSYIAYQKK